MSQPLPPIRLGLIAVAISIISVVYVAAAKPFSLLFRADEMRWQVVVDGVMGGLSTGGIDRTEHGIMFSGKLSLENNGGFSQIRSPIDRGSFEGADGIEIEVRGDGRSYIFDARVANMRVMAGSYQHGFDTVDGEWTTIRMPFTDFKFHYFGRLMENVGAIEPGMVDSIGVTLADYNPGAFELEVGAINGYTVGDEYSERLTKLVEDLDLSEPSSDEDSVEREDADRADLYADRLRRLVESLGSTAETRFTADSSSDALSVMELCGLAIDRGVPLFNHGQHEACASVYEVALASISHLGGRTIGKHARSMIQYAIEEGRHMNARDRAWRYRHALDEVMRVLSARV